ncbi:MAG: lysophospholipid acyltransferase family protein [Ignavibacteriaceae bacterium]|nr:lysophospholipid acyltransferase family protein [Ignavibacteriaceae bacterium]
MKLRKLYQDFLRFVGNYVLYILIQTLCKTLRIQSSRSEAFHSLLDENKKFVLAFWHGTMVIPWFVNRNLKLLAIISKSKDGDLLAKILRRWNYKVVRGSSSTGGNVALEIMIDHAKHECPISITPDGPRGPNFKMKAGAVITAKKSEVPLVLVGVGYKSKTRLHSWDNFEVPFPFSKVQLVYSEPIVIDKNLSYDETSKMILQCEKKLNELQKKAQEFSN